MSAPEERLEWARVRALMMAPNAVWLTTVDGERWLTDSYTLLNVTGSRALWTDERHESEIPDGRYKLTAGKGPVGGGDATELVAPDVAGLLRVISASSASGEGEGSSPDDTRWLPVEPTLWTVAESGAKAMLCYAREPGTGWSGERRYPLLINEEVWTAYHDYYDRSKTETRTVRFERDPFRPAQPFRVMVLSSYTGADGEEVETAELLAYVMGAHIPPDKWGPESTGYKSARYIVNAA